MPYSMGLVALTVLGTIVLVASADKRPNIVIFLADDLGIGDVGCFGNDTLRTPRLDQMAREGVKLTQHFSGASFCTPSRAALLTGRYPIRSGMAPGDSNLRAILFLASKAGLPANETTIAEVAKSVGYKTAMFGKWHLGFHKETYGDYEHSPMNQGFDYYFGHPWTNLKDFGQEGTDLGQSTFPRWRLRFITAIVITFVSLFLLNRHGLVKSKILAFLLAFIISCPVSLTYFTTGNLTLLNSVLVRNKDVIEQPIVLQNYTHRIVHEAVNFLDQRKSDGAPFLMYVSWVHVHTHIVTNPRFTGRSKHGRYGDGVEELDWAMGQMLDALDERGFRENTFAYFSSDNGGHLEEKGACDQQDGGWNGVYKGGKTHGAVDGGIRVPTIVRWPARFPKNTVSGEPTIFVDLLPTVANIIGASLPRDRIIDGKDMTPLLSGKDKMTSHRFMVHYCSEHIHAARYRPPTGSTVWKLVYYRPDYITGTQECIFQCTCYKAIHLDEPELHDITIDPGEQFPLDYSKNEELQKVVDYMITETEKHRRSVRPVPKQFSLRNLLWRPSLQPCCGGPFPFCYCKEEHGIRFS